MVPSRVVKHIIVFLTLGFVAFSLYGCYSSPSLYVPPYSHYKGRATVPSYSKTKVVEKILWIPSKPRDVIHEVAPLETLWRISKMYGVSMESIRKANDLKGCKIFVGQKLLIPKARYLRNVIPLYPSHKWRYIILHHTATEIGKAKVINDSHLRRGFINGLGYHFLIDNGTLGKGDGQIEISPRWIKQQDGAHCKASGMNHKAIGIALVGNLDEERPTKAQVHSLMLLLRILTKYYHIPANHVLGHRDVPGAKTECPGKYFPWWSVSLVFKHKIKYSNY